MPEPVNAEAVEILFREVKLKSAFEIQETLFDLGLCQRSNLFYCSLE